MASPLAQGLFQKAIGESGAPFGGVLGVDPVELRAPRDQAWVESLGVKSLVEARALSTDALIDAARKKGTIGFSPVIDERLLTEVVPRVYAAGKQAHVPLLAGWNRDERAGTLSKDMTVEKWKAFASEHYGARADEFLALYPGRTDAEAVASADAYTTDEFLGIGTWQWIEAQTKTGGAPVYRYHFELPAPPSEMHPEGKYAWHSDDHRVCIRHARRAARLGVAAGRSQAERRDDGLLDELCADGRPQRARAARVAALRQNRRSHAPRSRDACEPGHNAGAV